MKLKFNGFLVLLIALVTQFTFAQDRVVSGLVSDNAGLPLPGVSVLVKGTKTGTSTDFDGRYSIKTAPSSTLVFSFLGMKTQEASASSTTVNVKLQGEAKQLNEVVVTAFGIKRNAKQLGYSVSKVKAEQITENSEPDLIRSLAGKVAGVNVAGSTGVAGSSTQITIRGANSFSQDVQPLIIVDGVAYSNAQVTTGNQATGGGGFESGLSSLDPNDIASMNVLKSAAAAALYGSRAVNGVIVITTKSGSSGASKANKLSVTASSATFFENIGNLPTYQNTYGAGSNFNYANANGSWGPRFDSLATIPTWPSLKAAFPTQFGATVPYVAKPNNVKDLFRTGHVLENSFGFNYTGQDGSFNVTVSDLAQDGYIPYNSYDRTSISMGGNFKLTPKFSVGANMSYSNTKSVGGFFGENQFSVASSSFARTLFLARNWDLNLPYTNPVDGTSVTPNGTQFDHPLWSLKNDQIITNTNRTVAGLNLGYKFNEHISASYRVGINKYDLDRSSRRIIGSRASNGLGSLLTDNNTIEDIESTLLVNFDYKLSESIGFAAIVGNNLLQRKTTDLGFNGAEFKVPGIFTLNNVKTVTNLYDQRDQKRNVGFFADITLSYKDYLFLNATGRNDVSSSLPKANRSYFYPSVSASLIVTDALNIKSDVLTYAKLRASYSKVGRDATAEFTSISFASGSPYNFQPIYGNSTSLATQTVQPEFTKEIEVGGDFEFFRQRIVFDVSLYKRNTTNIITPIEVPASSGYTRLLANIGEMENKGIEIGMTLVPIKTTNFKWTLNSAYTKNENKVISLVAGLERFPIRSGTDLVTNTFTNSIAYVIPGQPFGVFYGTKFARDSNGNFLINKATGGIIQDPQSGILGSAQAKFKVSFTNTLTYKAFSLRTQFDWKQGGSVSSTTIQSLLGRGVTKDTEDREKTWIIPGYYGNSDGTLLLDGAGNKIPNTTQISTNELYFSPAASNTFGINSVNESDIYDATTYRLREASLTYDLPAKYLKNSPFGKFSVSVIGSNLWYFAPNVPKYTRFDPETTSFGSSNVQGVEVSAAPTAKRYGFKINLTF